MSPTVNLEAYFRRIGYDGPGTTSFETLRELQRLHTETIPFENLNPLLGLPVHLDPESLQQKLVGHKRGGYCFEQNLLFRHVLETIGFEVEGLVARIMWNQPEDRITPRSHMLLLVSVDEQQYIVDVGFGGQTPTAPLLLKPGEAQETPHEPFLLTKRWGDYFILQTRIKDEWKSLYRFDLEPQFLPDYEVVNWYLSHYPESHFVTGLIASRPDSSQRCRYVIHNNEFAIHRLGSPTERQTITSADALDRILREVFHLSLPKTENLLPTLERLAAPANKLEK